MNIRSPNLMDQQLGANVRAIRREIGMTQPELAALLNLSNQQIDKYERGRNRIAAVRLLMIAAALGRPVMDFFEGVEISSAPRDESR